MSHTRPSHALIRNDRATLEPAGEEASYVVNRKREEGILLGTDGPHHNVLVIRAPMPFSNNDADRLVATIRQIMSDLLSELARCHPEPASCQSGRQRRRETGPGAIDP